MNILTFDIEEWFHILDNDSTKSEINWLNYEVRIHENVDRILNFLSENNLSATFFVVGWIAENYPEVVNKIHRYNYEIGSHTHMHQLMYNQSREEVELDIRKSIETLENITGKKVRCFRAPGFSIRDENKWVFEVLHKNGIEIDCSIFPARRAHGGMPKFKDSSPSIIEYNGFRIKEFPINTKNFFLKKLIFSGGGYFRAIPYFLIKKWSSNSNYIMTYFHPRDFDKNQPILRDINLLRRIKCYIGINQCYSKLSKWVNDFDFIDLKEADKIIEWDEVNINKI